MDSSGPDEPRRQPASAPVLARRFLRWTVLPELGGQVWRGAGKAIIDPVGHVSRLLRQRARALWAVESKFMDGSQARMRLVANCPPFATKGKRGVGQSPCFMAMLCPFCWNRQAEAAWRRVRDRLSPFPKDCVIVTSLHRSDPLPTMRVLDLQKKFSKLRSSTWARIGRAIGRDAGGMYEAQRVIPARFGLFRLEVRRVYLVPRDFHAQGGLAVRYDRFTEVKVQEGNVTNLAKAFAWVFRYPGFLLLGPVADIERMIAFWQLKKHSHHRAGLGLFSGNHGKRAGSLAASAPAVSCVASENSDVPSDAKGEPHMAKPPDRHPEIQSESVTEALERLATRCPTDRDRDALADHALGILASMAHVGLPNVIDPGTFIDALIASSTLRADSYEKIVLPILDEAGIADPVERQTYLAYAIDMLRFGEAADLGDALATLVSESRETAAPDYPAEEPALASKFGTAVPKSEPAPARGSVVFASNDLPSGLAPGTAVLYKNGTTTIRCELLEDLGDTCNLRARTSRKLYGNVARRLLQLDLTPAPVAVAQAARDASLKPEAEPARARASQSVPGADPAARAASRSVGKPGREPEPEPVPMSTIETNFLFRLSPDEAAEANRLLKLTGLAPGTGPGKILFQTKEAYEPKPGVSLKLAIRNDQAGPYAAPILAQPGPDGTPRRYWLHRVPHLFGVHQIRSKDFHCVVEVVEAG